MKYVTMLDRFLNYVKFETRSDANNKAIPSTPQQKEFLKMLKTELEEIGLSDIVLPEENCFLTAILPSNTDKEYDKIGFISHVDTADFNAENINPNVIKNYNGKDILLNKEHNISMTVQDFPNLENYIGKTLITTDGTTLLGADDKAGVVEIVEAMKYLIEHPEIEHGDIKIAFGPDEEIGRGADNFDAKYFDTDYAYTMDGGVLGELQYESFNAAQIIYKITGVSVHPGTAKNKMKNATTIAAELAMMFPEKEVPEHTEGYEGFYMLHSMSAKIEKAELIYIVRDFDKEKFLERKEFCKQVAKKINEKYGDVVVFEMHDEYYNMGDVIKKDKRCVEKAELAMRNLAIEPLIIPIRGGTDGSKISYMGIPTPNIFVGGENFHGQYEFSCLEDMEKATDVIIEIAQLAKK
ncbi:MULTISPECIES: peptidase T [unclassified Gemella]|uniref:peptidase T n=1 Tax=unclassified Gemella TaxID=2624949 RepID=UPI001073656E|nr:MULTISPECIES: peptidase T [unclassified Gemella]MBF0709627.1 peptidase T [Gemella sp. GL1.1]MBF0746954.1 peptidase T [Gemella sp. 19428wG2_WT2a]NYS26971.1 peptidase T [Gemella sp. GL1]TFU59179.1 peptidase T [Gemella sp. WT2a]